MTQGKIERQYHSMKNVIEPQKYHTPSEMDLSLAEWVAYYAIAHATLSRSIM